MQRWQLVLLLQKAQVVAAMGDLHEACSICQEALDLSTTAGLNLQPHANAAQVLPLNTTAL